MSTYTQDITHLIGKINTNLPDNDTQAITAARIRDAMGAVAYNYDLYVLKTQLNQELGSYVLKTDLDTAGYVTASQLEGLVTDQELQEGMQSVLDDAYAYVVDKINEIPGVDLSAYVDYDSLQSYLGSYVTKSQLSQELGSYVTKTELSEAGYITSSDISDFVTEQDVQNILADGGYITSNELSQMSYINTQYLDEASYTTLQEVSQQGFTTANDFKTINGYSLIGEGDIVISGGGSIDLSAYVTKTELSNAGYITSIPNNYATYDAISQMGYVTESQLQQAGYITLNDIPVVDLSSYVTKTELSNAGYITSIPSDYVTYDAISQMGYVTNTSLQSQLQQAGYVTQSQLSANSYVTESELSAKGYVTNTSLSNMGYITSIPAEYVTQSQLSANSYVTQTELSGMGYLTAIPAEYVTESEIVGMGYVTTTDLSNASYVSHAELNSASYATSTDLVSYLNIANFNRTVPVQLRTVGLTTITTNVPNTIAPQQLTYSQFTALTNPWVGGATMVNYVNEVMPVIDESIIPNTTLTYTLGDLDHIYDATYTSRVNGPDNGMVFRLGNTGKVALYGATFRPAINNLMSLGTASQQWTCTYSADFIEDGTNIKDIYTQTEVVTQAEYDALPTADKNGETLYVISDQQPYFDNEIVTEQTLATKGFLTADNFEYDPVTGTLTLIL